MPESGVHTQVAVTVVESAPIMSMALSPDNSFILVNLASHTIHLWPVEPLLRQLDAMHSGQPISGDLSSCVMPCASRLMCIVDSADTKSGSVTANLPHIRSH